MKSVLVDSDILIEVSRARNADISEKWESLSRSPNPITFSPVSVAELWQGALPHEHKILELLFDVLVCLPIDKSIARRAGEYLHLFAKSQGLQLADCLVAATASVHDLQLWTRNREHYPMKDIEFF